MKKHKAQSIGELLSQYIQGTELERNLLERLVVQKWPEVMGPMIANMTRNVEMKNGTLFVHIDSAALRQQLFECRYDIIKKLNQAINNQFIKDIRILG